MGLEDCDGLTRRSWRFGLRREPGAQIGIRAPDALAVPDRHESLHPGKDRGAGQKDDRGRRSKAGRGQATYRSPYRGNDHGEHSWQRDEAVEKRAQPDVWLDPQGLKRSMDVVIRTAREVRF